MGFVYCVIKTVLKMWIGLNCILFWTLGKDVFPHCAGAKHAASSSPLWSRPSRKACFEAHERCRGHLQVLFLKNKSFAFHCKQILVLSNLVGFTVVGMVSSWP